MTFNLTDSLIDQIQQALDNQEQKFVVDAQNNCLIEKTFSPDEDNFYDLPEWTSANGFALREDFVNNLHSPIAKEELKYILHSGRGVFKSFRNVLKNYPEVEKQWHFFKNRAMQSYINNWYNDLREIWGLEKLDFMPEADENLIHDDFSFSLYDSDKDKQTILQFHNLFTDGLEIDSPETIRQAMNEVWKNQFLNYDSFGQTGFICHSLSDEFAGCITASPVTKNQEKVFVLSSFFVPEAFRGLGIGTELLSMCLSKLKANGTQWIMLPNIIIPQSLETLLEQNGFQKLGSGYAANLNNL